MLKHRIWLMNHLNRTPIYRFTLDQPQSSIYYSESISALRHSFWCTSSKPAVMHVVCCTQLVLFFLAIIRLMRPPTFFFDSIWDPPSCNLDFSSITPALILLIGDRNPHQDHRDEEKNILQKEHKKLIWFGQQSLTYIHGNNKRDLLWGIG